MRDGIRETIRISKNNSQSVKNVNVNGTITSNSKIIANTIIQFFCDIPKKRLKVK